MFVSAPLNLAIRALERLMKGRSPHKIQCEFPKLKKRYWGRRFGGRAYFSATEASLWNTSYFST
ncbi:MAG: transposase [Paracoccaceae bacterium]